VAREVNDIVEEFGDDLYTEPEPCHARQQIHPEELADMDLLDAEGHEIPLYTKNGYQIECRLAALSEDTKPHGILMNLRHLGALFEDASFDDSYDDLFDDIQQSPVKYYVYPQAGLVTAGHFQANGLLSNFQKRLNQLNARILTDNHPQQDANADTYQPVPITGIGCQGYNALMHCTRGLGSQHHDAQKGVVTAALSGAWATTEGGMDSIARSLKLQCSYQLPHQTYDRKIAHQKIHRDLRLENVYAIDIHALPENSRNGK
jgi:hypothetical protein